MFTIYNDTENLILLSVNPELVDPYYLFVMQSVYRCDPETLILQPSYDCEETRQFDIDNEFLQAGYYNVQCGSIAVV